MGQRRSRSKREQILQAALQLFAEHGVRGTSVRNIAEAVGVTEAALYRHFPSKDALAHSLFVACAQELYEHLAAALEDCQTSRARLCALARAFLDFARREPAAYEYVMARHYESVGELPPDQPLPKDLFVQVIEQGQAAGEIRPLDPQLAAAMMIGMLIRVIFFAKQGLIALSEEEICREICAAVQRLLLLPAAQSIEKGKGNNAESVAPDCEDR